MLFQIVTKFILVSISLWFGLNVYAENNHLTQIYTCDYRLVYDLETESIISSYNQPIVMHAQLEQIPLWVAVEGNLTKYTAKVYQFTGLPPQDVTELTQQTEQSLYVLYDHQGQVKTLYGQANIPAWNYNSIKALILSIQIILPNNDKHVVKEQDDKGIAVVEYTQLSPSYFKKQRKHYEKLWSEGGMPLHISKSDIQIYLNQDKKPEKIELDEEMLIGTQENPMLTTHYRQQFSLKETVKNQDVKSCQEQSLQAVILAEKLVELPFGSVVDKEKQRLMKKEQLKNVNLNETLSLLKSDDLKTWSSAFALLIDILSYYPEYLPQMLSSIEKQIDDKVLVKRLVSAIAHADCPQAQATLLEVIKKFEHHEFIVEQAIVGHHFSPLPAAENIDYLKLFYKNTSNQELKKLTLLALGTLAKKVDATKPKEEKRPITEFILNELFQAKSNQELFTIFNAIGNIGDIATFDTLKKMAANNDVNISSWAIEAMRQIPLREVEQEIAATLKISKHAEIQLACLRALHGKELDNYTLQTIINRYPDFDMNVKSETITFLLQPQLLNKSNVSQFLLHSTHNFTSTQK